MRHPAVFVWIAHNLILRVTQEQSPRFTVYIPRSSGPRTDRVRIARALGHLFLHYLLPVSQGSPEARVQFGLVETSPRMREEALAFACALLVPPTEAGTLLFLSGGDTSLVARHYGADEWVVGRSLASYDKVLG